jgi:hypothetical protein
MRETRTSGSEGGEPQANGTSLPLSFGLAWLRLEPPSGANVVEVAPVVTDPDVVEQST